MAVESTVVKTSRDGVLVLKYGSDTYTIAYEDGDLQVTPPRYATVVVRDRGDIAGERKGQQEPGSVSFSAYMREFTDAQTTGGNAMTLIDFIEKTANAAAFTSTGGTGYEETMCDMTYTVEGTNFTDDADHALTCTKVKLVWDFAEAIEGSKFSVSGEILGAVTRTGPLAP
jgi:hypothetical protein